MQVIKFDTIENNLYKNSKTKISKDIFEESVKTINYETNPANQYMHLFNWAIALYGNQIMNSLGIQYLWKYAIETIDKLTEVFSNQWKKGFKVSEHPYDGFKDPSENYFMQVIYKIDQYYRILIMELESAWINQGRDLTSEKLKILLYDLSKDKNIEKVLLLVDSTIISLFIAETISKSFTSREKAPIKNIIINSSFLTPQSNYFTFPYDEFDQKVVEKLQNIPDPKIQQIYDLEIYYAALKDIISEDLFISKYKDYLPEDPNFSIFKGKPSFDQTCV